MTIPDHFEKPVWEQQVGESDKWFTHFTQYRLQGPSRSVLSIAKQASALKGSKQIPKGIPGSWAEAMKKWYWRERALAWDAHVRAEAIAKEQQERDAMMKRHIAASMNLQGIGMQAFIGPNGMPVKITDLNLALRLIESGIKQERQARGVPTELIAIQSLTDDELLARHRELLASIRSSVDGDEEAWLVDTDIADDAESEV